MTGIAPGAYVRAVSGMYRGATGRVTRIDDGANGPYATVDVGGTMWPTIAVYVSALELVGAVPTVEQERDAAIAERDEAIAAYRDTHAVALLVQAERDRLRRELEALLTGWSDLDPGAVHARLEAILRGGES